VAAVLGDALHRVSLMGGREGVARSLGSVLGASVALFLGGDLRGGLRRHITRCPLSDHTHGEPIFNSVTFSRDGSTLLAPDAFGMTGTVHVFDAHTFERRRVVGHDGNGPLGFRQPHQLCVADDGFVFVADTHNNRVQVLTPALDFHGFVGAGQLRRPAAVCADNDVVAVSETERHRVTVFRRSDGKLLTRIGRGGRSRDELEMPLGLCFMSGGRHIAVANAFRSHVSIFTVEGHFIRRVGMGVLTCPEAVACSALDELVVADRVKRRIFVFSDAGDVLMKSRKGSFSGVSLAGGRLCSIHTSHGCCECIVFS
jgi:DNA-binding beta-propeller fold protein YncE